MGTDRELGGGFHEARTEAHAKELITEFQEAIAPSKVALTCTKNIHKFPEADPVLLNAIIQNFTLVAVSGDPVDEMRRHLAISSEQGKREQCRFMLQRMEPLDAQTRHILRSIVNRK